jgi:hypothetical protein
MKEKWKLGSSRVSFDPVCSCLGYSRVDCSSMGEERQGSSGVGERGGERGCSGVGLVFADCIFK